jgi:hypothetical protein
MHEFASPHHRGPEHHTEYLEIDEALLLASVLKLDKEAQVGETQWEAVKCWKKHANCSKPHNDVSKSIFYLPIVNNVKASRPKD